MQLGSVARSHGSAAAEVGTCTEYISRNIYFFLLKFSTLSPGFEKKRIPEEKFVVEVRPSANHVKPLNSAIKPLLPLPFYLRKSTAVTLKTSTISHYSLFLCQKPLLIEVEIAAEPSQYSFAVNPRARNLTRKYLFSQGAKLGFCCFFSLPLKSRLLGDAMSPIQNFEQHSRHLVEPDLRTLSQSLSFFHFFLLLGL